MKDGRDDFELLGKRKQCVSVASTGKNLNRRLAGYKAAQPLTFSLKALLTRTSTKAALPTSETSDCAGRRSRSFHCKARLLSMLKWKAKNEVVVDISQA